MKPASQQTVIDWVEQAWLKTKQTPETVAKSFLVTSIVNNIKEAGDQFCNEQLRKEIQDAFAGSADYSSDDECDNDGSNVESDSFLL